jgi:hypothetical protein
VRGGTPRIAEVRNKEHSNATGCDDPELTESL